MRLSCTAVEVVVGAALTGGDYIRLLRWVEVVAHAISYIS